MRAALYHRTSAADDEAPEAGLVRLQEVATARVWEVVAAIAEDVPARRHAWPRRRELAALVAGGEVDLVAVESLHRLARSATDLVDLVGPWLAAGVHLVATQDRLGAVPLDTTHPTAALRVRDALDLLRGLRHDAHAEACRAARALAPHPPRGEGRPPVLVNDLELVPLYESGLSIREVQHRLARRGAPASYGTLQARLAHLRAQGRLDEEARAQAIAARGGLPKGGRPQKRKG